MPRHGSRLDLSAKAIAHHYFIALPPLFYESRDFAEIVTVVCVAHYDEGAMGRRNSRAQRRAVPSRLDGHDSGAQLLGNFDRAVRRTVVRNDYFASQSSCMKSAYRFRDANPNGVGFIQARNHYGDFDGALRVGGNARLVGHAQFLGIHAATPVLFTSSLHFLLWPLSWQSSRAKFRESLRLPIAQFTGPIFHGQRLGVEQHF